jgi:hypothetical protein
LPDFIAFWGGKWYFKPYLKTKNKIFCLGKIAEL